MAGQCSGGKQVEGFTGLSLEYMRSPKFLQADGGYERVVWLPKEVKDALVNYIPADLIDKIPTEEDVNNIKEIRTFLEEKEHPILERLKVSTEEIETDENPIETSEFEEIEEMGEVETRETTTSPVAYAPEMTLPTSSGMKIILKNAKIYAEKVIIKRK
jgi:acetyl-CoA decarbonylase/synthase complex subunit beta